MPSIVTPEGSKNISSLLYVSPQGTYQTVMRYVGEGYSSAQDMLSKPWFQIAHRGGSRDFSEHSEQAYINALSLGYGAFEVALATSSDGVLFLMHDSTLLRTSGIDQSARATPWSTIEPLKIFKPTSAVSGASDRPYMTFQKYLDTFGKHVVSLIDTKYLYPADRIVMRDMITASGAKNRVIGKVVLGDSSSYVNSASLAKEWQTFGVPVAGLMYASNQPDFSELVPTYDILGMEYTAEQSVWDSLKNVSGSKKIIGHIAPNTSAVLTAKTKGANGAMCSSPTATPVLTS